MLRSRDIRVSAQQSELTENRIHVLVDPIG